MDEHAVPQGARAPRSTTNATGRRRPRRAAAALVSLVAGMAAAPLFPQEGSRWILRGSGV
jgi:hypothetical protein